MKYTYEAHLGLTGNRRCYVPERVAENQEAYAGKTFHALVPAGIRGTGLGRAARHMRVRLVGSDYGLGASGTGDMIVRPLRWLTI